jgi:hypothetical protein
LGTRLVLFLAADHFWRWLVLRGDGLTLDFDALIIENPINVNRETFHAALAKTGL